MFTNKQNIHVQGKGLLKANCYGSYISDVLSFNRELVRLWLLIEINCAPFCPFPSSSSVKLLSVRRLHNWTKKMGTPFFARFDWKYPFEIYPPLCRATWSGINISNLATCTEISWGIKIIFFAIFFRNGVSTGCRVGKNCNNNHSPTTAKLAPRKTLIPEIKFKCRTSKKCNNHHQ